MRKMVIGKETKRKMEKETDIKGRNKDEGVTRMVLADSRTVLQSPVSPVGI